MKRIGLLLGLFFGLFIVSSAIAGGINHIGGFGSRGSGMAAGIATAKGTADSYYNPALLPETPSFAELGLEHTNVKFKYTSPTGKEYNSEPGKYFMPAVGISHRLNDKLAIGIGIYTPFALGSDFKDSLGLFSKMSLTNLAPALAFKVSDNLTLGLAVKAGLGQVELSQPTAFGRLDSKADGYGYSGQVGLLWKPAQWLRLGATYQSKTKVSLDGNAKLVDAGASDTFKTDFYFPGYYGLGIGMEFGNLLIAADYMRFDYSSNNVAINYSHWAQGDLPLNWQSNNYYGVGVEYKLFTIWRLRAGYAYQDAVIPDSTISPATPDMNGHALSCGFGYRDKEGLGADIAFIHAWGPERTVNLPNSGAGKYSADINTLSAAVSYRW